MKNISRLFSLWCFITCFIFSSFAHSDGLDGKTTEALDRLLADYILFTGETGIAFNIKRGESQWGSAAGLADLKKKVALRPDHQFLVGSHSKIIVATIAMQLIDEGLLRLDSKISDFFNDYPKWDNITVLQLMTMSSGIPDFLLNKLLLAQLVFNPHQAMSPKTLLSYAKNSPLRFVPGTSCNYSQSNPFLLALIIEAVTKRPLHQVVQERIAGPLNLKNTFFPTSEAQMSKLAHGYSEVKVMARMGGLPGFLKYYFGFNQLTNDGLVDTTALIHPSLTWAAGSLVSSPEDMTTFQHALWHGKLIAAPSLETMVKMHSCDGIGETPFDYGAGMFEMKTDIGMSFGHGGLQVGYYSTSYFIPTKDITYSLMSNYIPGQMTNIMNEALKIVDQGPSASAALGACELPEGYLATNENNVLSLRFRGPINAAQATTLTNGIGHFYSVLNKSTQDYSSLHVRAQRRGDNVVLTSTGVSYSGWYNYRQVELSLPQEFASQVEPNGKIPFDKSQSWLVVRDVVKNPSNSRLMRACVSAIAFDSKTSSLYVCDPSHLQTTDGAIVKIFGRIHLNENAQAIASYLQQHKIEKCQCYDDAGLNKACK